MNVSPDMKEKVRQKGRESDAVELKCVGRAFQFIACPEQR
jgi:hypothetical protein